MDKFLTVLGGVFLVVFGVFFLCIFMTLIGGVLGWVVGLFFGDTILGIAAQLGIKNVTMFQFGAFLGFVGGFLKTSVSTGK